MQETAHAADEISRRVEAIQIDTAGAVAAISQISAIVTAINSHQLTIASAVGQQTATTNEMSRSATEAATDSNEIAVNVDELARSSADLRHRIAAVTYRQSVAEVLGKFGPGKSALQIDSDRPVPVVDGEADRVERRHRRLGEAGRRGPLLSLLCC